MTRHTYQRRDGSTFTIELSIDVETVAEDMARRLTFTGGKRAKKVSGGIVAEIVEDSRDG